MKLSKVAVVIAVAAAIAATIAAPNFNVIFKNPLHIPIITATAHIINVIISKIFIIKLLSFCFL